MNPAFRPWAPSEIATLRERYLIDGPAKLANDLGRTWDAVQKRAGGLGLHRRPRWNDIEDRRLIISAEEMYSLGWLTRRFKRSQRAVYNRLKQLGLARHDETLTAAERRTGFDITTLYRITAWAGVKIRRRLACPTGANVKRAHHVVDRDDLNEAIERWMATETISAAARRYGCGDHTVSRALARLSGEIPLDARSGKQWRLPSDLIDRAMAARKERAA